MLDGDRPPDAKHLSSWLGARNYQRWNWIRDFIDTSYPGVFSPDWLFGGQKYGWGLRFKKSKSFCTLIPERQRLVIQIVFGADERKKVDSILPELSRPVRDAYSSATTYHDGKWLALVVDNNEVLADVVQLLAIKRRPETRR